MIKQTNQQHEGLPVFCFPLSATQVELKAVYCAGKQIGYIKDLCGSDRERLDVSRNRMGIYSVVHGVRLS